MNFVTDAESCLKNTEIIPPLWMTTSPVQDSRQPEAQRLPNVDLLGDPPGKLRIS